MLRETFSIFCLELTDWTMSNMVIRQRGQTRYRRCLYTRQETLESQIPKSFCFCSTVLILPSVHTQDKFIESRNSIINSNSFLFSDLLPEERQLLFDHYPRVLICGIRVKWILNENFLHVSIKVNESEQMIVTYTNETSILVISSNPYLANRCLSWILFPLYHYRKIKHQEQKHRRNS